MDRQATYKQWLDNEYKLWVEALQVSAVHNFKDHPQVQRMLSTELAWVGPVPLMKNIEIAQKIDRIGYSAPLGMISGCALRMLYYANEIMNINPPSIVEIGGGVGQFYAILRAMGYSGDYWIYDLPEVKRFQYKYLTEVMKQTGLNLTQRKRNDYCLSLYALGEFDDRTKRYYIKHVINKCPHGYIVWNPHSGATEEVPFEFEYEAILQKDGSTLLTW